MNSVVTRFAPSPTGHLHIGGARTALFCFLFSRRHNGKFLLRLEDTDKKRSKEEYATSILESLRWLGLSWDGEVIRQSERRHIYTDVAGRLLETGHAYGCICPPERLEEIRAKQLKAGEKPKYDGHCRDRNIPASAPGRVLRFRNPQAGQTALKDLVKGEVRVENTELDDMILLRSDGSPTYNLCAVADDIETGVTHVLRGDDHLTNSIRQLCLYAALQQAPPHFAHLPLILNPEGKRLSKRDAAESILAYRDKLHILPEALCCYLARLGWSHKDKEFFDREELIELFGIEAIQKSPAGYDEKKLRRINTLFLKRLSPVRLASLLKEILPLECEALFGRTDAPTLMQYHLERAEDLPGMADELTVYCRQPQEFPNHNKFIGGETPHYLRTLSEQLGKIQDWRADNIKTTLQLLTEKLGIRYPELGMPLRIALTGKEKSAPTQDIAFFLGKQETCDRLDRLRDRLRPPSA